MIFPSYDFIYNVLCLIIYYTKFAKDHSFLVKYFLYLEEITQVFLCFLEL